MPCMTTTPDSDSKIEDLHEAGVALPTLTITKSFYIGDGSLAKQINAYEEKGYAVRFLAVGYDAEGGMDDALAVFEYGVDGLTDLDHLSDINDSLAKIAGPA